MKQTIGCAVFIVYLGIGLVQLLASINGIQLWFDWPWILAALVSLFVAYIPVVGTVAGIVGATAAWGWGLWPTIALFCSPYVLYVIAILTGAVELSPQDEQDEVTS